MKPIKICLAILIGAMLINFIKDGESFHIAKVLPFANGSEFFSPTYDWAGLFALGIIGWGAYRLAHRNQDDD